MRNWKSPFAIRVMGTSYSLAALIMDLSPHFPLKIFSEMKTTEHLKGVSLNPSALLYRAVSQGMLELVVTCLPGSRTPWS